MIIKVPNIFERVKQLDDQLFQFGDDLIDRAIPDDPLALLDRARPFVQKLGEIKQKIGQRFKKQSWTQSTEQDQTDNNQPLLSALHVPQIVTPKTVKLDPPSKENTVGGYNFSKYASAPDAIPRIRQFYEQYKDKDFNTPEEIQTEIDRLRRVSDQANPPATAVTGKLVLAAAHRYRVDPRVLFALIRKETSVGINLLTPNNFANILNTDTGNRQGYDTPEKGMEAAARELLRRVESR